MSDYLSIFIILSVLISICLVGLIQGAQITNLKEYALGNRGFSTTILVCTVVATWFGGDDFLILVSESDNTNGLYFIWSYIFYIFLVLVLLALVLIPRMKIFLGDLSIAESMGKLCGTKVRLVTAVTGCLSMTGVVAAQFKISGMLFEHCFDIPSVYGIVLSSVIVTAYSAYGGINSVTFTDVVQFVIFSIIITVLAFFVFNTLSSTEQTTDLFISNKNFNYQEMLNLFNTKSLYDFFLFLYIIISASDPTIFQRISMAKHINQARNTFLITAGIFLLFALAISWIGATILTIYPSSCTNQIMGYVATDVSYTGFKGLFIAGAMTIIMSTADSCINSTSILFTNDFCQSLGIKIKNELQTARVFSLLLGLFATILALHSSDALQLVITSKSFYIPIVSIPFTVSLLGFRTNSTSILIGMISGFFTVVIWEALFREVSIDSAIPGMIVNTVMLFSSHYFLYKKHSVLLPFVDLIRNLSLEQFVSDNIHRQ